MSERWVKKKEECRIKYDPFVREDERRYKLELAEYNKKKRLMMKISLLINHKLRHRRENTMPCLL